MGHALDTIAPIVLAVAGNALLPGLGTGVGAALGGGLGSAGVNYSQNHSFGRALEAGALGGAGSYVGGQLAGALGPDLGTISGNIGASSSGLPGAWDAATSSAMDATAGAGASSDIASSLGGMAGRALNVPVSNAIGSYAGSQFAGGYQPAPANTGRGLYEPTYNTPGGSAGMPTSLNSMASLTPQQQSSSLATQGAYGGGLGPEEQGYFKNLVNNEIVGGQSPNAIENSYLSKLGFGNEGSNYNLAKALSQWNPNA